MNNAKNKYLETIQIINYFLAYAIRSGQGMYFVKITTTRHQQRLLLVDNILYTKVLQLTIWSILLDEAYGVANGFFEAESLWRTFREFMIILVCSRLSTCVSFVGRQILLRSLVSGLKAWTVVFVFCAW